MDEISKEIIEKLRPTPYPDPSWHYPSCGCSDFVPKSRTREEMIDDFAMSMLTANKCHPYTFNDLRCKIEHIPTLEETMARIRTGHEYFWKTCEFMVKHFGEMSKDDIEKFQVRYREQIRQDSKGSDESSNSHCEKGSGEGNEVHFLEGNGEDV